MELKEKLPGFGNVSVVLKSAQLIRLHVFAGFLNVCPDVEDAGA